MAKNQVYLVEIGAGQFRKFTDWPSCQAFVSGKPYAFAGGKDEFEAKTKIEKSRRKSGGLNKAAVVSSPRPEPLKRAQILDDPALALATPSPSFQPPTSTKSADSLPVLGAKPIAQKPPVHASSPAPSAPRNPQVKTPAKGGIASQLHFEVQTPKPKTGICSDAGTHGNPGPCEYQVCDMSGKILIHKELGIHTNNYAELAGIGAMLRYAIDNQLQDLYTDSKICMFWIRKGDVGESVHEPDALRKMLKVIREMLLAHKDIRLIKWPTRRWGQIPADFGRK